MHTEENPYATHRAEVGPKVALKSVSCSKVVPCLSGSCHKVVPKLRQNRLKVVSTCLKLSQSCPDAVPKLSRCCPKVVYNLSPRYIQVISNLSQSCLRLPMLFMQFSSGCSKWCGAAQVILYISRWPRDGWGDCLEFG